MVGRITVQEINNRLKGIYTVDESCQGVTIKSYIIHNKCGTGFLGVPSEIIRGKSSCPQCRKRTKYTVAELQQKINDIKGQDSYILNCSEDDFKGVKHKHSITHSYCGYTWETRVQDILSNKSNCLNCLKQNSGFDNSKPAIIYFFAFEKDSNEYYYKIGITNRSVKERHRYDWSIIHPIWEIKTDKGINASTVEKMLLERYSSFKINTGILKSGNTETLTKYISKEEALRELEIMSENNEIHDTISTIHSQKSLCTLERGRRS